MIDQETALSPEKPQGRNATSRSSPFSSSSYVLFAVVACVAVLLVFVLPLFVPSAPVHGISASYLAGFNNSVAVLGATGLSVAVLLFTVYTNRPRTAVIADPQPLTGKLSWTFTAVVVAFSSAILGTAGYVVHSGHERYLGDAGYIIEQASTWSETGRHLYAQIEFAYGPLLLVPEAWLSRLTHLDMMAAYVVVLVLESALGLLMLAFLLNHLPVQPRVRQGALILFALGALTPHLGLNYTFFRFGSPLAFFLLAASYARSPFTTAALFSLAIVADCAISPELAFALAVGVIAYAGLRTWHGGPRWLIAGIVPLAVLATLLLTVGHDYLRMVSTFSQGVYNLPIGPYPHVLILLFAVVWLVPVYLGRFVLFNTSAGAATAGLYAVALAMVPAALRRCDPLHVFFNGIGILVLSAAAASGLSRRACTAWMACLALLILWEHRVNENLFSWRTAYTVQRSVLPHTPAALRPAVIALTALPNRGVVPILHQQPPEADHVVDYSTLYRIIGNDPVAIPFEVPPVMETELKATHHYQPLFHAFGVDMMDGTAERNEIAELEPFHWVLLPTQRQLSGYLQTPTNVGPLQGVRMYFHQRHAPVFIPGTAFEAGIAHDWEPVTRLGIYTLYRRRTAP